MQRNLDSKLAAHGTNPMELQGGQVGLEKHTKKVKGEKTERYFYLILSIYLHAITFSIF